MADGAQAFRKFTVKDVTQLAATKASDQKKIRQQLRDEYPHMEPYWEDIIPKKSDIMLVRCSEGVDLLTTVAKPPEVLFFSCRGGPYLPHLRLLHKFPWILPHHQVDIGGCKFVVSGANVMCPGLTSPGGRVGDDVPEGKAVAVHIEGKQHAVSVGITIMSSEEIRRVNKDVCISNVHHIGDGLWHTWQLVQDK